MDHKFHRLTEKSFKTVIELQVHFFLPVTADREEWRAPITD